MDTSAKFFLDLNIEPGDIDAMGHVNNVVYLRWVQDAAEAHWNMLSTEEERSSMAWVVLRHEIDYKQSAKPTDSLFALTWVGETESLRSIRYVQICRKNDPASGESLSASAVETKDMAGYTVLAEAKTTWLLVHKKTQRPRRIGPEELSILFRKIS